MDKRGWGIFRKALLGVSLCLLLAPGSPAFAQTSNAEITGLVIDPSGASVPGVQTRVVNIDTNVTVTAETNTSGVYAVSQLVPGVYRVATAKTGFKTIEETNVVLRIGDRLTLNFVLEVSTTRQQITVTSQAPLVATSDARNADVLDNRMLTELPQVNRNTLDYMEAMPAVQGGGPQYLGSASYMVGLEGATYSVGGGQSNGTSVSIDGGAMNEGDSNVLNRAVPSPDAVGELRVQSGVLTADYGRYSGGIITASTKSGTNQFHGKAFEYFRNQLMNANTWYNNNHGISTTPSHQNNFGGAIGGPVWIPKLYNGRNQTFFFVAEEGQVFKTGSVAESSVPTAEERQGTFTDTIGHYDPATGLPVPMHIFDPYNAYTDSNGNWVRPEFPNAVIPPQDWAKPGHTLLNLYPSPNHAPLYNTSNQNNYWSSIQNTLPIDRLTVRVDENMSAAHRLNLRVSRYDASDNTSAPFRDGIASVENDLDYSGSLQYVWAASPTIVFEARAGFSYSNLLIANGMIPDPSIDTTTMGFDPKLFANGNVLNTHIFPGGSFGSVGYTPLGGYYPDRQPAANYNATAALTKIWGRHTIKAGFEYYHTAMHEFGGEQSGADRIYAGCSGASCGTRQLWNADNNTGYAAADLLLGSATINTWGQFNYSPFQRSFAGYAMDDWRVSSKLTVQLGLRIDHDGPKRMHYAKTGVVWDFTAKNVLTPNANWNWSQVQAADPALANVAQPGWVTNGVTGRVGLLDTPEYPGNELYTTNAVVPQPRLGISYAPNPKTVIHASGGTIYQGLYGMGIDAGGDIYYGRTTFDQILTLDGQHWISELGTERGLGSFPVQPDGTSLGYFPPVTTNKGYWNMTYGSIPSPSAGVPNLLAPHQNSPQEYEWGLTIQRQLGTSWVATAEYTGIHGIHMVQPLAGYGGDFNFTNVDPQFDSLGSALYDPVPNPFYGQSAPFSGEQTIPLYHLLSSMPQYSAAGLSMGTVGYMKANYLNMQVQSHSYHGLALLASYSIRKTLTTSAAKDFRNLGPAAYGILQEPNNLNEAYGVATYEVPQRLLMDYSYDLPVGRGRHFLGSSSNFAGKVLDKVIGGWGIAGITSFWPHGTPVPAPDVPNGNGAPNEAVRYSVNGNYKNSGFSSSCGLLNDDVFTSSTPCHYFNPAAFVRTPDYTLGNLPLYFPNVRNPGGFSTDGTVLKNFYFDGEHKRYLNVRVEAFNIFNHPNYGSLNANPADIGFGGVYGKSGNRVMQIGARIFF